MNPSQLVLKYACSRKEFSIEMVKRLTNRIAMDHGLGVAA